MLNEANKFIKEKKSQGYNIKVLKTQSESDGVIFSEKPEQLKQKKSVIIEGSTLGVKQVKIRTDESKFGYFLDGIERKQPIFNYNYIPVIYGYVAAVIMKRTDKKMHSCSFEISSESFYLPLKDAPDAPDFYFDRSEFSKYPKINIVNTGEYNTETSSYPQFPIEFESKANSDIQETRGRLERNLAQKWLKEVEDDKWLFVDGRLENKNNKILSASNIVGIIKSHHVYFFSPQEQNKIYGLKKGERTSVFQPIDGSGKTENVYTWYLKLHDSKNDGKLDFGIIRVEIPANEALLSMVDDISSWILLETNPIAFPASRWDRMIYPIKYCEDYLKSKAPSWAMIESLG